MPLTASVGFYPKAPRSLKEAGVSADEVGRTILKLLAARGAGAVVVAAADIRRGWAGSADEAASDVLGAYEFADEAPPVRPIVLEVLT